MPWVPPWPAPRFCAAWAKEASVVLSDGVPVIYRRLPFSDSVLQSTDEAPDAEAAIILECDGVARTRLTGLERHYLINIDHHATARPFADVNWIDTSACATAEMIFLLARRAGVKVSPEVATCLYTAVLTDTGSFCFPGTTAADLRTCAKNWCVAGPIRYTSRTTFTSRRRCRRCACWARLSAACLAKASWCGCTSPRT